MSKVSRFLLKSFHFRGLQKRSVFPPYIPNVTQQCRGLPGTVWHTWPANRILRLCIKVDGDKVKGTGTSGRVCGDLGLGTWGRETRDLRTSSMGRGEVWDGDAGTSNTGRWGRGMWIIIAKVGGKCDISHFPREYVLVKATTLPSSSSTPVFETKTRRRPPALKKVKPLSSSSCWWNIGAQSRIGWVAVAKILAE